MVGPEAETTNDHLDSCDTCRAAYTRYRKEQRSCLEALLSVGYLNRPWYLSAGYFTALRFILFSNALDRSIFIALTKERR